MKEKSTILIVDDSELNRTVLADILGDEYNFIEAVALRVSRRMVRQVVEHGACATVSTSVQSAVCTVQPFASSSARKEAKSTPEAIVPDER